jgi:hypothetical protein
LDKHEKLHKRIKEGKLALRGMKNFKKEKNFNIRIDVNFTSKEKFENKALRNNKIKMEMHVQFSVFIKSLLFHS